MKRDADTDKRWMSAALNLARRGLGNVWPNPAVGCVVVSQGRVVGRGWTQAGGRPHAEAMALAAAGPAAAGGCAYVTLEPCAHHGRTPPCADALIAARLARVVYAVGDPDPRVAGAGAARMKAAGLAVETDILADAAYALNLGFFSRVTRRRPMFTLKMAVSLDGRIATRTGASQWITGPAARAHGHRLRAEHDAIMVGSGTAVADDPALTCRLPGLRDRSPLRVLCDSGLRTPSTSKMFADQTAAATWVATTEAAAAADTAMTASGARLLVVPPAADGGGVDLVALAERLASNGLTRVLIEGGGLLAAAALKAGLIDQIVAFRGGQIIGGDGLPAVGAMAIADLSAAFHFTRVDSQAVGDDVMEIYRQPFSQSLG